MEKDPIAFLNICRRCKRIKHDCNDHYMSEHNDAFHEGRSGHFNVQYYLKNLDKW